MTALRLTRELITPTYCRGILELFASDGTLSSRFYTIEKPWIPNSRGGLAGEPFKSCVNVGTYALRTYVRPNGDKVWLLLNPDLDVFRLDADIPVDRRGKGRFLILIHIANRAYDVVGCIGPGRGWRTENNGTVMVTDSGGAMRDLHRLLDGRRQLEIEIRITE